MNKNAMMATENVKISQTQNQIMKKNECAIINRGGL